jgi:hypothetical protein
MSINAKLNRGPAKGRVFTMDDTRGAQDVILFVAPTTMREMIASINNEDDFTVAPTQHEYRRSNRRLANGTWIYEWMGPRVG